MKLNVDLPQLEEIKDILTQIQTTLKEISMTGQEALAAIQAVGTQLEKAQAEIVAKLEELTAALSNANLSPEAEAALADLKAKAQALDDIVPDAT
jgi:chromosome segregation ATPase